MTDSTVAPSSAAAPSNAGRGLAIAGLIIDFFISPLGLILSIVAKVQSRKAGVQNTVSTVGIVLGILFTIGYVIGIVVLVATLGAVASECQQLGAGVHHVGATTYTCGG